MTPRGTDPTGDAAILNLDPALVDPSFIADRMEPGGESYRALLASIADRGQIAPILVRPRRIPRGRAAIRSPAGIVGCAPPRTLGRAVRAILRPLTDRDLVIAQGQENSARADLSFIERARFAQALDERRYGRDLIAQALSTDKRASRASWPYANACRGTWSRLWGQPPPPDANGGCGSPMPSAGAPRSDRSTGCWRTAISSPRPPTCDSRCSTGI